MGAAEWSVAEKSKAAQGHFKKFVLIELLYINTVVNLFSPRVDY